MIKTSINGLTLEDQFKGFQTSTISGRGDVSVDVDEQVIGFTDGTRLGSSRINSRTLTLSFYIVKESQLSLLKALDDIKRTLIGTESKFIFSDETDSYYVGMVTDITTDKIKAEGVNLYAHAGSMSILCTDPFKHTVLKKTVTGTSGNPITIVNHGSKAVPMVITSTINDNTSMIAFTHQNGKNLQFGRASQVGIPEQPLSEVLFSQRAPTTDQGWVANTAVLDNTTGITALSRTGSFDAVNVSILGMSTRPYTYGPLGGGWHGPTLTKTLPPDSNGVVGATNWELEWWVKWETGTLSDVGFQQINVVSDVGKVITSVTLRKHQQGNNNAAMTWTADGVIKKDDPFEPNFLNTTSSAQKGGRFILRKMGQRLTIFTRGSSWAIDVPALLNVKATQVSYIVARWKDFAPIAAPFLATITFTKHNVDTWSDIPNRLSPGDNVVVDTNSATITRNNTTLYELDTIGNDWEHFLLQPGENIITPTVSPIDINPTNIVIEYEEKYI